MPWRYLHIGPEGDAVEYEGIKLWRHEWERQGDLPIEAHHPQHPHQLHSLERFFVQADGKLVQFAAGEVSAGAWLFWVPASLGGLRQVALRVGAYGLVTVGMFIALHGWSTDPLRYGFLGASPVLLGFGADVLVQARACEGRRRAAVLADPKSSAFRSTSMSHGRWH